MLSSSVVASITAACFLGGAKTQAVVKQRQIAITRLGWGGEPRVAFQIEPQIDSQSRSLGLTPGASLGPAV